jgi:hypothetical protein
LTGELNNNTMARIIRLMRVNDVMTSEIKLLLVAEFGEWTVEEFAKKDLLDIAEMLSLKEAIADPISVVEEIFNALKRLNLMPTAAPKEPISVEVKFPKDEDPAKMELPELLAYLAANPDSLDELSDALLNKKTFKKALRKTTNVAIPNKDGGLDVGQTVAYVTTLAKDGARVQREVNGQRPVTLEKALGLKVRPLSHPLTGEKITGPDENGLDYGDLPEKFLRALKWARETNHQAWPKHVDIYEHGPELFEETLNRRWANILSDFEHALEDEDEKAMGTSRYWTEPVRKRAASQRSSAPQDRTFVVVAPPLQPQRSDDYYRKLLADNSSGDFRGSGMSTRVPHGIYDYLDVSGMSAYVDNAIVLGGGSVSGMSPAGKIYVPHGVRVSVSGMSASVSVMRRTYEELCRIARLI